MCDDRIVHLVDPLPATRDLVAAVVSQYSFRVLAMTMRDRTDRAWLITSILEGKLPDLLIAQIADAVVEQIFGQPRWVVAQIWAETLGMWREVDAELGQRGVDLLALSPERATNTAYGVLHRRRSGDPDGLRRWLAELDRVPDRAQATEIGAEAAAADWFAMAALIGGGRAGAPPMLTTSATAGVDSELTIT